MFHQLLFRFQSPNKVCVCSTCHHILVQFSYLCACRQACVHTPSFEKNDRFIDSFFNGSIFGRLALEVFIACTLDINRFVVSFATIEIGFRIAFDKSVFVVYILLFPWHRVALLELSGILFRNTAIDEFLRRSMQT